MITLRLAELSDFEFFFALKSEPSNIFWTGHSSPPDRTGLKSFFDEAVNKQTKPGFRRIYIILRNGTPVGTLYLIPFTGLEKFELAPAISEKYWGQGIAKEALSLGIEEGKKLNFKKLSTTIREDNTASLHAFHACGVEPTGEFKMVYIPGLSREVKMFRVEKAL